MATYRITIKNIPNFNNTPADQTVQLSDDTLYAVALMSTALLGQFRDQYFEIRDKASRLLNIDDLINRSRAVVLEGDAAFELDPVAGEQWIDTVRKAGGNISKGYTIKIEGYYNFYLVQFDSNDFYRGLWLFPSWIGRKGAKFLKYLHNGNNQIVINVNA